MDAPLVAALERSRRLGFLGPGPVDEHVQHARGFLAALAGVRVDTACDLGSGGGVPGLALAWWMPATRWILLDAAERRTAFLQEVVDELGLTDRVEVVRGRAEELGHDPRLRGRCDAVVVRSFGPPPIVAECGAPLLRVGGMLVVSEPPDGADRWPASGTAELGLGRPAFVGDHPRFVRMVLEAPVPARYPRRVGIPAKRPLF